MTALLPFPEQLGKGKARVDCEGQKVVVMFES